MSLNVDEDVMKRLLHSLSCGKYQVLLKEPAGRTINTSDKFSFHSGFTSPLRKIRIPMASLDDAHNTQRVEEDRSIAIEAAIVREAPRSDACGCLCVVVCVCVCVAVPLRAGADDEGPQGGAASSAHHRGPAAIAPV